ncbi:uncharacterized protein LOC135386942 [Ornithodoros turicata]|uniref:uncharacterized protein LOC135386942 n=1 Tax=Ornithodoros turicata TaxID=34597 RepID=UPI00313993ED
MFQVTTTDGQWQRQCGFLGYTSLKSSEQALQDLCSVTMTVFSILLNMLPEQRCRQSDMTREDRLVLFLMKLKLGISFTALASLFGVCRTTAARAFKTTLDILSFTLHDWVYVPPRGAIRDTMPDSFKTHHPKCTFIIDCMEIRTEAPTDAEQQHFLYSHYKGSYTLKFLVCIIPNGMVAFLSQAYGGRHSDAFITRESGFLSLIEPGDVILSDKGFPSITTSIEGCGAVIVMPPFSCGSQLSEAEMERTYQVAQVRIHVERVIQRLKIFNVLNNRVPITLIPHMSKIMRVCGALVNLQSPIIKT